jgi:leishmanolysin
MALIWCAVSQFAAAAAAVNHECIHDSPDLQREQKRLQARNGASVQSYAPSVYTKGGRLFHAKQAQPLRIVFSFEDLTETGAFCSSASGTAPSYRFDGDTVQCTKQEHVLTDAKRAILRDSILPAAVERIQRFISVQPVVGGLRASSTTVCGADFTVPREHASLLGGVNNADLVIYVASSPIPGATVAFAGACQRDQNGRAVFGRMNFDTEFITWGDAATRTSLVDTAVHEIMHVMGITSSEFFVAGRSTTATKRGKTVRMVSTPTVRDFARTFSGCSTLEGAEVEDEEANGPEGSHWERKVFFDEVMAASGGGASALSGLTLGFLQDMNVGYTVTMSGAEQMTWGAQDGCAPFDHKCNTAAGLRDKYFCFDDPSARSDKCTFNFKAVGECLVGSRPTAFPSYFQYYSSPNVGGVGLFMDGCPHVQGYSNRVCNVEKAETSNDVTFGYMVRCKSFGRAYRGR